MHENKSMQPIDIAEIDVMKVFSTGLVKWSRPIELEIMRGIEK